MGEQPWEEYIGQWVHITPLPGVNISGKIKSIDEDYAILNPYVSMDYSTGKPILKIIENSEVPRKTKLADLVDIVATTKENLEGYCKNINEKELDEKIKEQRELNKQTRI